MYVFSYLARLVLAGVFLVAGTSKLFSGVSNSRKTLADFGAAICLDRIETLHLYVPTVSGREPWKNEAQRESRSLVTTPAFT
jgi:hypothetical protein